MFKFVLATISSLFIVSNACAKASDFYHYFDVDMAIELPDMNKYMYKLDVKNQYYDRGYKTRVLMGNKFKKEFSQTIKSYGLSEGRIKADYEDDLLQLISWLPEKAYQYVGPMLHEVPGMPEKILNLPGIKETKNQFPTDIADEYKDDESIEHLSPMLYFILMPEIWNEKDKIVIDAPQPQMAKKKKKVKALPDFLKKKLGMEVEDKVETSASPNEVNNIKITSIDKEMKTIVPTASSLLTTKDVEAFIATIDDINAWGKENNMYVLNQFIIADVLLTEWEKEQGKALAQNVLKDAVNPCQRLVVKANFAGLYTDMYHITSAHGYTPEEWAYTCDKTIKAYRVATSNMNKAYAVDFHRKGYYEKYISKLPTKWRNEMFATEAAIVKMHTVFKEDVDAVRGYTKILSQKFMRNDDMILAAPIIY